MLRFENETWLYLLLIIPVLMVFLYACHLARKRMVEKSGEKSLLYQLMPDFSIFRLKLKNLLYLAALSFLIIGLANPQQGSKMETVQSEGVDVMIALDVSKSMLAEDIKPSRLDRAKQLINSLIENMSNDRVGLIIFAGNAYLQMPLTADYSAAKLFLQSANPDIVPTQGTAIGASIELAMESFDQDTKKYKALVVITDGENHEDDAVSIAERAAYEGVIIHTVGVGSEDGAPVPVFQNGRRNGYMMDKNGEVVMTRLNTTMLENLAAAAQGSYFTIRGARNEIDNILKSISEMEKKEFEERMFTDYEDQFQYFIGFSILLMLIEFFISERKAGWFRNWNLFGKKTIEE